MVPSIIGNTNKQTQKESLGSSDIQVPHRGRSEAQQTPRISTAISSPVRFPLSPCASASAVFTPVVSISPFSEFSFPYTVQATAKADSSLRSRRGLNHLGKNLPSGVTAKRRGLNPAAALTPILPIRLSVWRDPFTSARGACD